MPHQEIHTFFDECQLNRQQDVAVAKQAFDYLEGQILPYLEAILDDTCKGISKWRERGVLPIYESNLSQIIEQSANTYQDDPNREIVKEDGDLDEDKTALYAELLEKSQLNQYINSFDESRRLGRASLILIQYDDETERIVPSILSRDNSDVKWNQKTRQIDALIYSAGTCGPNGGQLFHLWTPEVVQDIEMASTGSGGTLVAETPHDYGVVPVAYAWDIAPPRYGFWPKDKSQQLISLNDAVSLFHTQAKYAQKDQTFPTLFGDVEIPDGTVMGSGAYVKMDRGGTVDALPFLEYKAATDVDKSLPAFLEWLKVYVKNVGQQWGVNLRIDGNANSDSGFKLVVEEFPSLELRNKRIKSAVPFEFQLHNVYSIVSEVHGLGDITGKFRVDFKPPRLPVNDKEQWEIAMGKLATGVWSKEDFWRHENPDITEKEIKERKARIDEDKLGEAAGRLPFRNGSVNNGS
jgi:hypothetical protein